MLRRTRQPQGARSHCSGVPRSHLALEIFSRGGCFSFYSTLVFPSKIFPKSLCSELCIASSCVSRDSTGTVRCHVRIYNIIYTIYNVFINYLASFALNVLLHQETHMYIVRRTLMFSRAFYETRIFGLLSQSRFLKLQSLYFSPFQFTPKCCTEKQVSHPAFS